MDQQPPEIWSVAIGTRVDGFGVRRRVGVRVRHHNCLSVETGRAASAALAGRSSGAAEPRERVCPAPALLRGSMARLDRKQGRSFGER